MTSQNSFPKEALDFLSVLFLELYGSGSYLELCLSEKIVIIWPSSYFHRYLPVDS